MFRLFGKAVALCRRSRTRWRYKDSTSFKVLQGLIKDIKEATAVEVLVTINAKYTGLVEVPVSKRDLYNTIKAYRLSSLLQLYESFPDLITK
jgi:hypothetical protein